MIVCSFDCGRSFFDLLSLDSVDTLLWLADDRVVRKSITAGRFICC